MNNYLILFYFCILIGIDRGNDVSSDMLTGIYNRIQAQELKTGADHTTQVRKVEETMVGKVPVSIYLK